MDRPRDGLFINSVMVCVGLWLFMSLAEFNHKLSCFSLGLPADCTNIFPQSLVVLQFM